MRTVGTSVLTTLVAAIVCATWGCQPAPLRQREADKVGPLKTNLGFGTVMVTATFNAEATTDGTVLSVELQNARPETLSVFVDHLYLQLYEPKEDFPMRFTLEPDQHHIFKLSFPKEAQLIRLDDVKYLIEMEFAGGSATTGSSLIDVYGPLFTSTRSPEGQLLSLLVSHNIESRTMQIRITEMIRNGRNILRGTISKEVAYGSEVSLSDALAALVDRVGGEVTLSYEYRLVPNSSWQKSTTRISL